MSEVDRLSNSGLYPALPIADRRASKDGRERESRPDKGPNIAAPKAAESPDPAASPGPPKSHIDEYA
jgi:hypothetical protein